MNPPNRKPTMAPQVYKPQSKSHAAQLKMGAVAQLKGVPSAPPVYRPQPAPKVLQTKSTVKQLVSSPSQSGKRPTAPPVYQPQLRPKVLQTKKSGNQPPSLVAPSARNPVAPPVYRPQLAPKVLQRKESGNSLTSANVRIAQIQRCQKHPDVMLSQAKGAENRRVVQRAAAYYADYHCGTCNEDFSYGYNGAPPTWACENGHTNWLPGAAPVVVAAAAAAVAVVADPPRKGELMEQFKGGALSKNKQALLNTYYGSGKNKSHISHGSSKDKQFSMREELANMLEAIAKTGDTEGYEAARKQINEDFGTGF